MSDSCCSVPGPAGGQKADDVTNLLGPAGDEIAECVVMPGSAVVKADAEAAGLYRDLDGTRYWFCCAGCAPRFDANPSKYIAA